MLIIWTDAARDDLLEIRDYLKRSLSGIYVPELEELQLDQYRERLAGRHRLPHESRSRSAIAPPAVGGRLM
nr:hypothetical protein [Massilia sp. PDC64]